MMKGVEIKVVGEMYHVTFETYEDLVSYMKTKRPSQISVCFDGESLTASVPVAAYSATSGLVQ